MNALHCLKNLYAGCNSFFCFFESTQGEILPPSWNQERDHEVTCQPSRPGKLKYAFINLYALMWHKEKQSRVITIFLTICVLKIFRVSGLREAPLSTPGVLRRIPVLGNQNISSVVTTKLVERVFNRWRRQKWTIVFLLSLSTQSMLNYIL